MRENGRTRAMLFELMIVVLFLALSSMTLLRLFSTANTMSRDSEAVTYGALAAQDVLERLAAGEAVEPERLATHAGRTYRIETDTAEEPGPAGALLRHSVRVICEDKLVASLEVADYRPEVSAQ